MCLSGCMMENNIQKVENTQEEQTETVENTQPIQTDNVIDGLSNHQAKAFLAILQAETKKFGDMQEFTINGSVDVKGMLYANLIDFDGDGIKELICVVKPPDGTDFGYSCWDWTTSKSVPTVSDDDGAVDMRPTSLGNSSPTVAYSVWRWDDTTRQAVQVMPYRSTSIQSSQGDNYGAEFLHFLSSRDHRDHSVYIGETALPLVSYCILTLENDQWVEKEIRIGGNYGDSCGYTDENAPYQEKIDLAPFLIGYNLNDEFDTISIDGLDNAQICYKDTLYKLEKDSTT